MGKNTNKKSDGDWLLSNNFQADFTKKGEKTKLGGKGEGGIYRSKIDYVIKRVETGNSAYTPQNRKVENFRTYDEVLASRLFGELGGAVPYMCVVNDTDGNAYVAAERLRGAKDLTADDFKKLPLSIRENILSEQVIHAWLCNRDIVNADGENYVVDADRVVAAVDFGQCFFSGFRSVSGKTDGSKDDKIFVEGDPLLLIPGESDKHGQLYLPDSKQYTLNNKDAIANFFSTGADLDLQRHAYLQGVLRVLSMPDATLTAIVNKSLHSEEDKQKIIRGLQARRDKLVRHAQAKYGQFALEEEQSSLELRRVMHKAGIFSAMPGSVSGDAVVGWKSQYQNALLPKIIIKDDILYIDISVKIDKLDAVNNILAKMGVTTSKDAGGIIKVEVPIPAFKRIVETAVMADALQILLGSHEYKSTSAEAKYKSPYAGGAYKGDCSDGFRPVVSYVPSDASAGKLKLEFDERVISGDNFAKLLQEKYGLTKDVDYTLTSGEIIIVDPKSFLLLTQTEIGARKTAIVSENDKGQIMAGRLDPAKKGGASGFATAGGNADKPMNPRASAADEGGDEFGHAISTPEKLIPIGSTLHSREPNIFLAGPGLTSDIKRPIGYKEFKDGTIKYHSFHQFREASRADSAASFDRSSVMYYVKFYQQQIQQELEKLGFNDIIVICSKKAGTLGHVYIKPSITGGGTVVKKIRQADELVKVLTSRGIRYEKIEKISKQHNGAGNTEGVKREVFKVDAKLNPLEFLNILMGAAAVVPAPAPTPTPVWSLMS